ncbi:hypothetical protein OH77DRAFT_1272049 [Trametes cingulata]|nr:hypothetical protein OH77DRAFT_1272049 [Trametes cingulata]
MPALACPARCTTRPSPSQSHPARAPHRVRARVRLVRSSTTPTAAHPRSRSSARRRRLWSGADDDERSCNPALRHTRRNVNRTDPQSTRAEHDAKAGGGRRPGQSHAARRTTATREQTEDEGAGAGDGLDHLSDPPRHHSLPIPVLSDPLARPRRIAQKICTFASASVSASRSTYEYLRAGRAVLGSRARSRAWPLASPSRSPRRPYYVPVRRTSSDAAARVPAGRRTSDVGHDASRADGERRVSDIRAR